MSALPLLVTDDERAQHDAQGTELAYWAASCLVTDHYSFSVAVEWLRDVVAPMKRQIAEQFRPRIQQAHALHKGLVADEKKFLEPVERAERVVRERIALYEQECERERRALEETARLERERLASEEAARVAALERQLVREAEERQLTQAVAAEAAGDRETAARLLEAPPVVPVIAPRPVFVPPPAVAAPKAQGVSFRDDWSAEVVDLLALVKAVASGHQPLALLQANVPALNQMAKALKGSMAVPGIRVTSRRITSVRGA